MQFIPGLEATTSTCPHTFTKGTKNGQTCGKAAKTGGFCNVHGKKSIINTCNHIYTKGKKNGEKCIIRVSTANGFCAKHDELKKILSVKEWEEVLFSQIPAGFQQKCEDARICNDCPKLTRTTANNVAAWIMVTRAANIYPLKHDDLAACIKVYTHPLHDIADYFEYTSVPLESDVDSYNKYMEYKVAYECAKKIYASQYPQFL